MLTINFLGCGNVGKPLGRLWSVNKTFKIGDVLTRSANSAALSVKFIGQGRAIEKLSDLQPADVFIIATPDNSIAKLSDQLAESGFLKPGNIVFHCSGGLPSSILAKAKEAGAWIASIHPIKSFAEPDLSVKTFFGTFCGAEGDAEALKIMDSAFKDIGAQIFPIKSEEKPLYHAASIFVCNYLTALIETGIQTYMKVGFSRESAVRVAEPIVRETVENIFKLGTVKALTGPIARGDHQLVAQQLRLLNEWNPNFAEIYKDLGRVALELSENQKTASTNSLAVLKKLLSVN